MQLLLGISFCNRRTNLHRPGVDPWSKEARYVSNILYQEARKHDANRHLIYVLDDDDFRIAAQERDYFNSRLRRSLRTETRNLEIRDGEYVEVLRRPAPWISYWKSKVSWKKQLKAHKQKGGLFKDGNVDVGDGNVGDFADDPAAGVLINEDAFWYWLLNML